MLGLGGPAFARELTMVKQCCWSAVAAGILALALALALGPPASAAIPGAERAALIALYDATNGPGWTERSGWLGPSGTECSWHGVSCNPGETAVTQVFLVDNGLVGQIPAALADLESLEVLGLLGGDLGGSIPPELGSLAALRELRVADNELTGGIPAALAAATSLEFLDLSLNQLTGTIPPEIGDLSALRRLTFGSNQLSGPIPPELGTLVDLELLILSDNQLRGPLPAELGSLTSLENLFLSSNHLWGDVPPSFLGLTSLRDGEGLDLRNNHLSTDVEPGLLTFLNAKQWGADWTSTQTPAPFCIPDETTLCIAAHGREWRARMSWQRLGDGGDALAVPLGASGITQGGSFAFRNRTNPEVLLKILDFCALGGTSYAVFYAATTDAGFALTVDDPARGQSVTYNNDELVPAVPIQDLGPPFFCE